MVEQLWPAGQHNAAVMVVVVFSERHTVFSPQQKSEGNPLPHCERAESPPHVSARFVRVQSSFSHSCGIHSVRANTARSMQGSAMRVVKVNMIGERRVRSQRRANVDASCIAGAQADVCCRQKRQGKTAGRPAVAGQVRQQREEEKGRERDNSRREREGERERESHCLTSVTGVSRPSCPSPSGE